MLICNHSRGKKIHAWDAKRRRIACGNRGLTDISTGLRVYDGDPSTVDCLPCRRWIAQQK